MHEANEKVGVQLLLLIVDTWNAIVCFREAINEKGKQNDVETASFPHRSTFLTFKI